MITEAILDAIQGFMHWLGGLLPTWDVEAVFDSWGLVTGNLAALNYYLPISELFAFVLSVIYLLPAFLGVSLTLWLAAFVRGGSSRA